MKKLVEDDNVDMVSKMINLEKKVQNIIERNNIYYIRGSTDDIFFEIDPVILNSLNMNDNKILANKKNYNDDVDDIIFFGLKLLDSREFSRCVGTLSRSGAGWTSISIKKTHRALYFDIEFGDYTTTIEVFPLKIFLNFDAIHDQINRLKIAISGYMNTPCDACGCNDTIRYCKLCGLLYWCYICENLESCHFCEKLENPIHDFMCPNCCIKCQNCYYTYPKDHFEYYNICQNCYDKCSGCGIPLDDVQWKCRGVLAGCWRKFCGKGKCINSDHLCYECQRYSYGP